MRVHDDDVADGGEERRARDDDALGRTRDALVGRLHVVRGEVGAVVELTPLRRWNVYFLPSGAISQRSGEVGDDGLPVLRIAAQQRVVHRALRADVGDGAGLVHVEVRGRVVNGVPQRAAALDRGIRLDRRGGLRDRGRAEEGGRGDGAARDRRGAKERAARQGRGARVAGWLLCHGESLLDRSTGREAPYWAWTLYRSRRLSRALADSLPVRHLITGANDPVQPRRRAS